MRHNQLIPSATVHGLLRSRLHRSSRNSAMRPPRQHPLEIQHRRRRLHGLPCGLVLLLLWAHAGGERDHRQERTDDAAARLPVTAEDGISASAAAVSASAAPSVPAAATEYAFIDEMGTRRTTLTEWKHGTILYVCIGTDGHHDTSKMDGDC